MVNIRGWAVGKTGHDLVDVRVRCGEAWLPVDYGFMRADLAQHFGRREPEIPGAFECITFLPEGDHQLHFEGCDVSGAWAPLQSLSIPVRGQATVPAETPRPAIPAVDFGRALRLMLKREPPGDLASAANAIADLFPRPWVTRFAHAPFHGHLHHPGWIARVANGRLQVEGWLFHEQTPLRAIAASVDLQSLQVLRSGQSYAYLPKLFPDFRNARTARFEGVIDVPAQLPRPLTLRIYAQLPDDHWELCHVQRVPYYDLAEEKRPYLPRSRFFFWRSWRALRRALRQRGFDVAGGSALRQEIQSVRREFSVSSGSRRAATAAASPIVSRDAPPPKRVWLVTHNLSRGGAPLFLLELAHHLASRGTQLSLLSAEDGDLRADFERAGAEVHLADDRALLESAGADELRAAIARHAEHVDFSAGDLVIANTLSCYWASLLAHRAGRPSLLYIHESTTPESFFLGHMAAECLPVVADAFACTTHVSFLTEATRRYYLPLLAGVGNSLNPGWVELSSLDAFRQGHERSGLRREIGVRDDTFLVVNLGTVCDRKGQHIFGRAVEHLSRTHPDLATRALFLAVGARDTPFDRELAADWAGLKRDNLRLVPETAEPGRFLAAADLFVCSSYEESFPRVVLEAMGLGAPIVSTSVHGIPEIVRAGTDALLVNPGDPVALAEAMAAALVDRSAALERARSANLRVRQLFDAATLLPHHAALVATIAQRKP